METISQEGYWYARNGTNGLATLETRIMRGDQTAVFKLLNGYKHIDRNIVSRLRKRKVLEDMKLH